MIGGGGASSGFGGLGSYLLEEEESGEWWEATKEESPQSGRERGRLDSDEVSAQHADRVSYATTRNTVFGADEPEALFQEMQDAAAASDRVEKEVYHLYISFPDEDQTTTQERVEAMEELLEDLELDDRQALLVEHDDAKDHLHAMVNRVQHDPYKKDHGTAWDTGHDWERIEHSLREIERDRGWREVPGKMSDNHSASREEIGDAMSKGQVQYAKRTGELPVQQQMEEVYKPKFEEAQSFEELDAALETRLEEKRFRVERKGRGGVVRDQDTGAACKLSSIDREYSLGRLEDKFGQDFSQYAERRDERDEVDERPTGQESEWNEPGGDGRRERPAEPPGRGGEGEGREGQGNESEAERSGSGGASAQERGPDASEENGRSEGRAAGSDGDDAKARSDAGRRSERGEAESDRGSGGNSGESERSPGADRAGDGDARGRLEQLSDGADPLSYGKEWETQRKIEARGKAEDWVSENLGESLAEESIEDVYEDISEGRRTHLSKTEARKRAVSDRIEEVKERIEELDEIREREGLRDEDDLGQTDPAWHKRSEVRARQIDLRKYRDRLGSEYRRLRQAQKENKSQGGKEKKGPGNAQGGRSGPGHGRRRSFSSEPSSERDDRSEDPSTDDQQESQEDLDYYDRISRSLDREHSSEDESEDEDDLLERLLDRSQPQEAREVYQELRRRRREEEARQLSRKWEKEDRTRLRLEGEEGRIRPSLEQAETAEAARAYRKLDANRRDEVWESLSSQEREQVFEGAAEVKRREAGVQEAYERLSEDERAIAKEAQISAMMDDESASERISEGLKRIAEDTESLSGKTSKIEASLPSETASTILKEASEQASEAVDQSQDDAPEQGEQGLGGPSRG